MERAESYAHLVVEGGLLEDAQELKKIDKRIVSVFVVDKRTRKICRSTKDTVVKSLMSLGVKPQRIVKGKGFFSWDILLPTPEDCLDMTRRDLITKDHIFRTEYEGRRRTRVAVFEVPPQVIGEHLAAYLKRYGEILTASCDNLNGGWSFEIMLDRNAFILHPQQSGSWGPEVAGHSDRP